MLEDPSIDVVHVLTPNKFHAEMTIAALESGKHVMCEKPMATNAQDAQKMVDAARKSGKKLTVAFQNRFKPENMMLKRIVERGDLGWIYLQKLGHCVAEAYLRGAIPEQGHAGWGSLNRHWKPCLDLTLWLMDNYQVKAVLGTTYNVLSKQENAANPWGPWDPSKFQVEESALALLPWQMVPRWWLNPAGL